MCSQEEFQREEIPRVWLYRRTQSKACECGWILVFSISSAEDTVTRQVGRRDLLKNMSEKETVDL